MMSSVYFFVITIITVISNKKRTSVQASPTCFESFSMMDITANNIQGGFTQTASYEECVHHCQTFTEASCQAVTYVTSSSKCHLKHTAVLPLVPLPDGYTGATGIPEVVSLQPLRSVIDRYSLVSGDIGVCATVAAGCVPAMLSVSANYLTTSPLNAAFTVNLTVSPATNSIISLHARRHVPFSCGPEAEFNSQPCTLNSMMATSSTSSDMLFACDCSVRECDAVIVQVESMDQEIQLCHISMISSL